MPSALKWLFDTDHLSLHERGYPGLKNRLEAAPPGSIATSVVTVEEMLRGRLAVLAAPERGRLPCPRVRQVSRIGSILQFRTGRAVRPRQRREIPGTASAGNPCRQPGLENCVHGSGAQSRPREPQYT